MLDDIRRERQIRKALRAIARQRVAMVLEPGDMVVVENSPANDEWFDAAARSCLIRGWVAVLHESVPTGQVRFDGATPVFPELIVPTIQYRLTEAGWAVLNRAQGWVIATFVVATLALAVSTAGLVATLLR